MSPNTFQRRNSQFFNCIFMLPVLSLAITLLLLCPRPTNIAHESTRGKNANSSPFTWNCTHPEPNPPPQHPNYENAQTYESVTLTPRHFQISMCTNLTSQDTALFSTGLWLKGNKYSPSIIMSKPSRALIQILLLISGQISPNPGPVRFPCKICTKPVKSNQKALEC